MTHYCCSNCGAAADFDAHSGDSPILVCGCDPSEAEPVEAPYSEADEWDDWIQGR